MKKLDFGFQLIVTYNFNYKIMIIPSLTIFLIINSSFQFLKAMINIYMLSCFGPFFIYELYNLNLIQVEVVDKVCLIEFMIGKLFDIYVHIYNFTSNFLSITAFKIDDTLINLLITFVQHLFN